MFVLQSQRRDCWSPRILPVTCSLDVMIWSMSVRSLASSGALWTSQASTSASYWPVVWDSTCLYTASEIWRGRVVWNPLDWTHLVLSCLEHVCSALCRKILTSIQFLCFCCIFPFRRGLITFLSSGWRVSITRLARICSNTDYSMSFFLLNPFNIYYYDLN